MCLRYGLIKGNNVNLVQQTGPPACTKYVRRIERLNPQVCQSLTRISRDLYGLARGPHRLDRSLHNLTPLTLLSNKFMF